MPYRKYKKRSGRGAYSIAKKALKKVNRISRGVEHKHLTTAITQGNVDDDGSLIATALNIPVQGLLDSNRIGDTILCKSVHLRINYRAGDALTEPTQFRFILFWDKMNTVSAVGDILANIGDSNAANSHYDVDTRREWIKLMDKTVILTSPAGSSMKHLNKVFKLNKITQFIAAGTTISKGALRILYISNVDSGAADNLKPNVVGLARLFYTDS